MDKEQEAERIIRGHVGYAMVAGLIPIPMADIIAVTAVHLDVVRNLAELHGKKYDLESGKALVAGLTGVSVARIGASALKMVPGIGSFTGGAAQIILSGASTYAIGKVFDRHFAQGGTLSDFNLSASKTAYEQQVEEGKRVAQQAKDETTAEQRNEVAAVTQTLERLGQLKKNGELTEDEYEMLKEKALSQIARP